MLSETFWRHDVVYVQITSAINRKKSAIFLSQKEFKMERSFRKYIGVQFYIFL